MEPQPFARCVTCSEYCRLILPQAPPQPFPRIDDWIVVVGLHPELTGARSSERTTLARANKHSPLAGDRRLILNSAVSTSMPSLNTLIAAYPAAVSAIALTTPA